MPILTVLAILKAIPDVIALGREAYLLIQGNLKEGEKPKDKVCQLKQGLKAARLDGDTSHLERFVMNMKV